MKAVSRLRFSIAALFFIFSSIGGVLYGELNRGRTMVLRVDVVNDLVDKVYTFWDVTNPGVPRQFGRQRTYSDAELKELQNGRVDTRFFGGSSRFLSFTFFTLSAAWHSHQSAQKRKPPHFPRWFILYNIFGQVLLSVGNYVVDSLPCPHRDADIDRRKRIMKEEFGLIRSFTTSQEIQLPVAVARVVEEALE